MTGRTGGTKTNMYAGNMGRRRKWRNKRIFLLWLYGGGIFAEHVCFAAVKSHAWQQPSPLRFSAEEMVVGEEITIVGG